MTIARSLKWKAGGAAAALGLGAVSYAACAGRAWLRYGHPPAPAPDEADVFLDRFMPEYDVAERHHLRVDAPAEVTFAAAMDLDLQDSLIVRGIFKARELALGAEDAGKLPRDGLIAATKALGWRVLVEVPGREIVMGAVTQPWMANPVFRGLPPDEFAGFNEPDYVKIAWTLRADAVGPNESIIRTETRAIATDPEARRKFRRYWARFSAGIIVIREIAQRLVKKEAERRACRAEAPGAEAEAWSARAGAAQRGSGSSTEMVVPPVGGTSM